jgi:hypothetical protein
MRYRWLDPRTPACSEWMSPAEWAAYRTRLAEALASPAETQVVALSARP